MRKLVFIGLPLAIFILTLILAFSGIVHKEYHEVTDSWLGTRMEEKLTFSKVSMVAMVLSLISYPIYVVGLRKNSVITLGITFLVLVIALILSIVDFSHH